ncbi:hypothetical protein D3C79_674320 [compost metagenome]
MASQLQGRQLELAGGQRTQLPTHGRRTGKGNLANDRRADQVFGDLCRFAEHQVQHPGRYAGIMETAHQFDHRTRRLFRPLEDDAATRRERTGDLAHGLVDREVPGRESRHRTNGLTQHQLPYCRIARRDHAAIGPSPFFGVPLDMVGSRHRFSRRLGQRLALVTSHAGCHTPCPLPAQCRSLAQNPRTVVGRGHRPTGKTALCSAQCSIQVSLAGQLQLAHQVAGGGVKYRKQAFASAGDPLTIDVQGQIGIHATSSLGFTLRERSAGQGIPAFSRSWSSIARAWWVSFSSTCSSTSRSARVSTDCNCWLSSTASGNTSATSCRP